MLCEPFLEFWSPALSPHFAKCGEPRQRRGRISAQGQPAKRASPWVESPTNQMGAQNGRQDCVKSQTHPEFELLSRVDEEGAIKQLKSTRAAWSAILRGEGNSQAYRLVRTR
jgi:hypothetical protein